MEWTLAQTSRDGTTPRAVRGIPADGSLPSLNRARRLRGDLQGTMRDWKNAQKAGAAKLSWRSWPLPVVAHHTTG